MTPSSVKFTAIRQRLRRQYFLQLAERDEAAGHRQRPEHHLERDGDALSERHDVRVIVKLGDADERGRRRAERERDRNTLGHGRHRNARAERHSDHGADPEA